MIEPWILAVGVAMLGALVRLEGVCREVDVGRMALALDEGQIVIVAAAEDDGVDIRDLAAVLEDDGAGAGHAHDAGIHLDMAVFQEVGQLVADVRPAVERPADRAGKTGMPPQARKGVTLHEANGLAGEVVCGMRGQPHGEAYHGIYPTGHVVIPRPAANCSGNLYACLGQRALFLTTTSVRLVDDDDDECRRELHTREHRLLLLR